MISSGIQISIAFLVTLTLRQAFCAPFVLGDSNATSSTLVGEGSQTSNETVVLRKITDADVNRTATKVKLDQDSRSSEWKQNALGKWEFKGKRTTPKKLTSKQALLGFESIAQSTTKSPVEIEKNISIPLTERKDIRLILQPVNLDSLSTQATVATTRPLMSDLTSAQTHAEPMATTAVPVSSSASTMKAEIHPSVSSTITALLEEKSTTATDQSKLIPDPKSATSPASSSRTVPTSTDMPLVEKSPSNNRGLLQALVDDGNPDVDESLNRLVLRADIPVQNSTHATPIKNETATETVSLTSAIVSSSSATSTSTIATVSLTTEKPVHSIQNVTVSSTAKIAEEATPLLVSSTAASLSSSSSSSLLTSPLTAAAVPASEKTLATTELPKHQEKIATNETIQSVYNSLSDLAGAGLKVGEKLEVSAVDSKTNTIILSIHSDNVSSDAQPLATPATTTIKPTAAQAKIVIAAKPQALPAPHPAVSPNQQEFKPVESHRAIPLIALGDDKAKKHWSGAANALTLSKYEGPRPEGTGPYKPGSNKDNLSLAASKTNIPVSSGPVGEPEKKRENGHAKAEQKRVEGEKLQHWSGSAGDFGNSQYHAAKTEETAGSGSSSKGHRGGTPAPAYHATVIGYEKVPYLWDSLMQSVMGMVNTASGVASPMIQAGSQQASSVLSSLPSFDFGSLAGAGSYNKAYGHVASGRKG